MFFPFGGFIAKVALEGLLAPVTIDRVFNWCKGGDGLVLPRVLEELFEKGVLIHIYFNGYRGWVWNYQS